MPMLRQEVSPNASHHVSHIGSFRMASPGDSLPICGGPGRAFPLALCFCWTCSRGIPLPHRIHYSIGVGVGDVSVVGCAWGCRCAHSWLRCGSQRTTSGLGPRVPSTFCLRQGLPLARQLALVPPGHLGEAVCCCEETP